MNLHNIIEKLKSYIEILKKSNRKTKALIGLLVCLGVLVVGVVAYAVASGGFLRPGNATSKKTAQDRIQEQKSCDLPQKKVLEHGFSVGVPKGWEYELANGTVTIKKDKKNEEGALIYTARLKKDLSAKEFLTLSAGFFAKDVKQQGGRFEVVDIKDDASDAEGRITASINGKPIEGLYTVKKEVDFITLKAYYAPVSDMKQSKKNLQTILACYERDKTVSPEAIAKIKEIKATEKATPTGFSQYKGKYFTLGLPAEYKVTGESDSGIDISRNDNLAGFSYAYVTGAKGLYSPESWTRYALPEYMAITSLELSSGTRVPSDVPGEDVQEYTFTGILQGSGEVKGKVTTGIINTPDFGMGSSTSAFWAVQIAKPNVWSSVSDILGQMQNSLKITDIGETRKKVSLPPNRPMESSSSKPTSEATSSEDEEYSSVDDQVYENWAEAMRGYVTGTSPTTGDTSDVPLNNYDPYGPQGPGYYQDKPGGGKEKLDIL